MKRARSDQGVTLVEVLVALVVGGIILSAITGALIAGLRTTDATTSQLGDSHDTQLVANYLPNDVASAAPAAITTSGTDAGCGGGSYVVRLPFSAGAGEDAKRVVYRTESAELVRYACGPTGTARDVVAHLVSGASATATGVSQMTVTLTVTRQSGSFTVTASGRTPTSNPPPATSPPATTGPTTTTTTTTLPPPCVVTAGSASPNPVTRKNNDTLNDDVNVSVTTTGMCSGLSIRFTPTSTPQTLALTGGPASWTVKIGKNAYTWTTGSHLVEVLGATNSFSFNLGVTT